MIEPAQYQKAFTTHVTINGIQYVDGVPVQPSLLDHPAPVVETVRLPVTPYPGGVPHVAGSDTSTAAAESMTHRTGPMQAEILRRLATAGDEGWTCDEIEYLTDWSHQSASARIRELVKAGLVVDSGERRKGRSGRTGRVYRLAP